MSTPLSESGFESGTLAGWTYAGDVVVSSKTNVQAGPNNYAITPFGSFMGKLTTAKGIPAASVFTGLGLGDSERNEIQTKLSGYGGNSTPVNGAFAKKQFDLNAGVVYTISWQYNSVDYVPWNDGSVLSVVSTTDSSLLPALNGSASKWAFLGFTNPNTGEYSTGSYGSTGWQTATIVVPKTGSYVVAFGLFNLGDAYLDPVLFLDSEAGTTTNNGKLVSAVPSNSPPKLSLNADKGILKAGDTATLTFTLSEASKDFSVDDITVSGGTLSGFVGTGTAYTATFTPFQASTTAGVVSVASGAFSSAAGTKNADGAESDNKVSMTVDTLSPTVAVTSDKQALKASDIATITFSLSESSSDFGIKDVAVSGGSLANFAGSGTTYTATFTPTPGSTSPGVLSVANGAFSDAVGNQNVDGADSDNQVLMAIDTVRPTLEVSSDKESLKAGDTATITFTLSESSSDFSNEDVTVSGGTLSKLTGSGAAYTATFTPNAGSTTPGVLSVASGVFSNVAGNTNEDGADNNNKVSMGIDTRGPRVSISSDKQTLKAGDIATISFTLSEASTDFSASDVAYSGGKLSGFAGSGTAYTATYTPESESTTPGVVSVASGVFTNAGGFQNTDGTDKDNTVSITVDTVSPKLAISSDKQSLLTGETATVTFALSEASGDFSLNDISVSGGTLSSFNGSGTVYSAKFTPVSGSVTPGILSVANGAFSDAAGNKNADGTDSDNLVTIAIDTLSPVLEMASNKQSLKAGETASVTFTLSEVSSDFTFSDVAVSGGTISNFKGTGAVYTATFTPTQEASTTSVLAVTNGAFSNAGGYFNKDGADANNALSLAINTIRPSISVSTNRNTLKGGESTIVSFTLSETSKDFAEADILVSGGKLSDFTGSGTVYSATFTLQSSSSTGVVSVASNKFSNASGNFNVDGAEANNSVTVAGAKLWGTNRNDYGRALATGPDGSIYLAGETEGNLGGQSGSGMRDIFLSKMNPDGSAVWTKLAGTRLVEEATHLAVASDGSVYMSGTSQASLNGAGNSGSYDAYLLKYDPNGNLLWTARQGTNKIDRGFSVAADNTGAAYLVGQTESRFDGQRNLGNFDGFITKYSAEGSKLWTRMLGTAGIDAIKDVVTDAAGYVYVTGSVSGTLAGQTRIGGADAFVAKYANDGTVVWTKLFGTKTTDYAESIALGSDGSIYVAGQTLGSMNGASSGNYDVFLTKFSAAGEPLWSRQFGSGKADNALDLVVGLSGDVTLTGYLGISSTLGLGLIDAFTASFSAAGTQTGYEVFGTNSNDYGTAVAEGLGGVIYLAGYTFGSVMNEKASHGAADVYLFAKVNRVNVSIDSGTVAASAAPDIFLFDAGGYGTTLTNGFAYGDQLVFPEAFTGMSVVNTSPSDGEIIVSAIGPGQRIQVTLTGVAPELDAAVISPASFLATFGMSAP